MAKKNQPDFDLDADPASTYGATQEYIDAWNEKFNPDGSGDAPSADQPETPAPSAEAGTSTGTSTGTRS